MTSFPKKHAHLIFGLTLLTLSGGTALALYLDVPAAIKERLHKSQSASEGLFSCPMHPDVAATQAGDCSKCGMKLVKAGTVSAETVAAAPGHEGCATNHSSSCCEKKTAEARLQLPPGHPPVAGFNTAVNGPCTRTK